MMSLLRMISLQLTITSYVSGQGATAKSAENSCSDTRTTRSRRCCPGTSRQASRNSDFSLARSDTREIMARILRHSQQQGWKGQMRGEAASQDCVWRGERSRGASVLAGRDRGSAL